jgi:hypothetical protein
VDHLRLYEGAFPGGLLEAYRMVNQEGC